MAITDHRSAPRPGGRSARVVDAVHTAVTELIGEATGPDCVTVPAVASRAGVNPTTIYRRWGDLETLLVEVAMSVLSQDAPVPDTGSLERDLQAWTDLLVTDISRPERRAFLRTVVGSMTDERSHCLDKREAQVSRILDRARERGEPDVPTLRDAMDLLLAPLYFRVLFGYDGVAKSDARRMVSRLVACT
ncbi:TetR family transcriptional regulator [Rhodococcoides trifolii]|uniref:TetR family transcriptional regulator n=1 Tax=Rhodococcoides trifolii TaxID=908250 RepID=A0A917CT87_9NOCA|nr:TetR/AcrR family transcriptional regulator [Rhodococcus trifolii]GGF96941.1 TetR family transcriptional regulator [Rhodococcus trifolii]